ncbi:helix-turn-helix domain-containing protein [Faecalispora anaeroviscerum]|uniref:helix-turn-helix domain-containing protein n=1 Tax=Faecalispora anaeroviscerum TaxID=2991836 RepID=UPI0024B9DA4D|nr:helix-turn-helix transcriptional regulator [Faecalispora anaeroviscerum]
MKFYDIFYQLCQQKGVTPTQVSRDIKIRQSTVSMWKKQGTTPNAKTLQKIAEYFGVSTELLLIENKEDFQLYIDSLSQTLNNLKSQVYTSESEYSDVSLQYDHGDISDENFLSTLQRIRKEIEQAERRIRQITYEGDKFEDIQLLLTEPHTPPESE